MMDTDKLLVEQVLQQQDQQAFARLMQRHQLRLRAFLMRTFKQYRRGLEGYHVDDLLQEVFLRAYLALSSFRQEAQFSTWLYRIANNLLIDKCRRKSLDYCAIDAIEEPAANCHYLHQSDLRGDITRAMQSISNAQKTAVRLCLEEGYTHEAAALVMNLPLGTVKSHVLRGKANLQQLLSHWSDVA
jgi:RNA polymerase sigma-70 factor, ECF subfamily